MITAGRHERSVVPIEAGGGEGNARGA